LYAYYLFCFFASFLVFNNPLTGALFSLFECSLNILLLILSIMLPIYYIGDNPLDGNSFNFGIAELIHFFLAGSVLLYSFYVNPLIMGRK
jgi:hypothetical protein